MNILICDDIRDEALRLENAVKEAGFEANVTYFYEGADVLNHIKTGVNIDICFLDIIMPEMNGIELARNMRSAGFGGKIVFLTSSNDYSAESYQVKAYSYLLKPVNTEDVAKLLNGIKNGSFAGDTAQLKQCAGIKIETRNMSRFVYFYEISFVEVINKNVYFHLLEGSEIVISASFSEILPKLVIDGRFVQCHRSFVVNMDAIAQIRGKEIFLRCGKKAPVSRSYQDFNKKYFMHIFGEGKQNS